MIIIICRCNKLPDPDQLGAYAVCGAHCEATDYCAFFWAYGAGKEQGECCMKSAVLSGAIVKPRCTTCAGEFYNMTHPQPQPQPAPTPPASSSLFEWGNDPILVEHGDEEHQLYSQITWRYYDIYLGIVMVFDATVSIAYWRAKSYSILPSIQYKQRVLRNTYLSFHSSYENHLRHTLHIVFAKAILINDGLCLVHHLTHRFSLLSSLPFSLAHAM